MTPYKLFHEGMLALSKASKIGFRIDEDYCRNKIKELDNKVEEIINELNQTEFIQKWQTIEGNKFNMDSTPQLSNYLYNHLKLTPPKKTDTGRGSTDAQSLEKLGIPELKQMVEIKKIRKIRDTYLQNYLNESVNGVLHPNYNLNNVVSYRGSCNSPNLTNVSKNNEFAHKVVRNALFPRKGHQLMEIDYVSLEVIIGCCLHKDKNMIKYLQDPKSDMHSDISKEIYLMDIDKSNPIHSKLRFFSKGGFTFAQNYGSYYVNCAQDLARDLELPKGVWEKNDGIMISDNKTICEYYISKGIKNYKDFENHIRKVEDHYWNKRFYTYGKWRDREWEEYKKNGYMVSPLGFKYQGIMTKKLVINYKTQGTAFHVLLWCLIRLTNIFEEKGFDSKIIGNIHDSIVFDINPDELEEIKPIIRHVMTKDIRDEFDWIILDLDIDAEISGVDKSWYEMEGMEI